jgi:hypothetical protein
MNYGNTGVASVASGGALAYTGASDVWFYLALLLLLVGAALIVMSQRNARRDALQANVGPRPRWNFPRRNK